MILDRRSFISAAVAAPLLIRDVHAQERLTTLGLELYTVRTELEKDFDRTLARVAAIGYKEVECFGYYGRSPVEMRAALQKNGLAATSAQVQVTALGDSWPDTVEAAHVIGHQYLVLVSPDRASLSQPDIWRRTAERLNRAGEVTKAAGITLAYHNHLPEFADAGAGKRQYDILLESTEPALVSMQMDLCWAIAAGQQPVDYFRRYPRRFVSVHVKDLQRIPSPAHVGELPSRETVLADVADVGSGVIDWTTILPQCWSAGIRHYFVEHDQPPMPLSSVERSYRYLEAFRFPKGR